MAIETLHCPSEQIIVYALRFDFPRSMISTDLPGFDSSHIGISAKVRAGLI